MNRLKHYRELAGLKEYKLSRSIGAGVRYVYQVERYQKRPLRKYARSIIKELTAAYDKLGHDRVTIDDVFDEVSLIGVKVEDI